MDRGQPQREGVHPAVATAAALGSVAAATVAVLAFVVGIFDSDDNGSPTPDPTRASAEPPGASAPVIKSLVNVPPSAIDAAGVSGPIPDSETIYLIARRPEDGEFVASTAARLSRPSEGDQLQWRALLELETTTLGAAVESGYGPVPYEYEVVAAVFPKVRSQGGSQGGPPLGLGDSYSSASASTGGVDLDDAEAVSAPRTVTIPQEE